MHSAIAQKMWERAGVIKVIFIMGASRSGSTVLNALLGTDRDTTAVGELTNLPRAGWINGEYCACGEAVDRCPFWTDVLHDWQENSGSTPEQLAERQDEVERLRYGYRPLLSVGRRRLADYGRLTTNIFGAVTKCSCRSAVVDASKNPVRAIALAANSAIDLRLIHLVRDVRGVAWSLKKPYLKDIRGGIQRDMPGSSFGKTAVFWAMSNALCEIAMKKLPPDRRMQLRYEDLVGDPGASLKRIEAVTDLDLSGALELVEQGTAIPFEHTVAGNRVRMSEGIMLAADFEWQQRMSAADQRRLRRIVWPFMHRYGYT